MPSVNSKGQYLDKSGKAVRMATASEIARAKSNSSVKKVKRARPTSIQEIREMTGAVMRPAEAKKVKVMKVKKAKPVKIKKIKRPRTIDDIRKLKDFGGVF